MSTYGLGEKKKKQMKFEIALHKKKKRGVVMHDFIRMKTL